ncbi:MAG: hypothetical protein AAF950_05265 [Pseudomonadota bacterium]
MLRLISLLLLLAGLGAAGYGGYRMYAPQAFAPEVEEIAERSEPPAAAEIAEPAPVERRTATRSLQRSVSAAEGVLDAVEETAGIAASEPNLTFSTSRTLEPDAAQKLRSVPVAYEVPEQATFGRPFEVTFALDGTGSNNAIDVLPNEQRIIENTADVGDKARAALLGSAFSINPLSPETQIISQSVQNVWRWQVTPREAGERKLFIELFAVKDGEALPVRTLNDVVTVEVSRVNQVIALANEANPIIVVLGGIGSALAGLFGVVRFFRGS